MLRKGHRKSESCRVVSPFVLADRLKHFPFHSRGPTGNGPSRNELREQTLLSSKCPSHWVISKVIILHPPTMVPVLTQLPAISLRARNERHVDYSEVLVLRSLRGTTILSRRAAGRLATHATTTSAEVSHPIGWDAICVDRVDPRVDILGNLHLQR